MSADTANPPDENGSTAPLQIPRGGPSAEQKSALRDALIKMRNQLARSSKDLADEALKGSGQDFKLDHMADFGSDNFEQDISLSLLEEETELLNEIDTAVRKIDGDEELPYGLCEACALEAGGWDSESGAPWIPTGRLEYVPYVRLCVAHQEEQEEG